MIKSILRKNYIIDKIDMKVRSYNKRYRSLI